MTKFKDVAHLYIGATGYAQNKSYTAELETIIGYCKEEIITNVDSITAEDFKPILRPFGSMNKIEKSKYEAMQDSEGFWGTRFYADQCESPKALVPFSVMAEIVNQLRRDGFDCDGLIKAGEAIDGSIKPE